MKKLLSILFLLPLLAAAKAPDFSKPKDKEGIEKSMQLLWDRQQLEEARGRNKPMNYFADPNYNGAAWNNTTITLTAGATYGGGAFTNFSNTTIDCNGATFQGNVNLGTLTNVIFKNAKWNSAAQGTCISQGRWINVTVQDCKFDHSGLVLDGNDNNATYNGTQASLKAYQTAFLRDTTDHAGQFVQGIFAEGNVAICYNDSTLVSNCVFLNTQSNGTILRGTFFRLGFKNNQIIYTDNNGVNTVLGDVGVCYYNGNGVFVNNYMRGGRGYIFREWHQTLGIGVAPATTWAINNVRLSTTTYGTFDTRNAVGTGTYITLGGIFVVMNNSAANQSDNINFWSGVDIIGNMDGGNGNTLRTIVKNNLGCNFLLRGKDPMCIDQSGGGWQHTDSSGNKYFGACPLVMDTITGITKPAYATAFPGVGATLVVGNTPPVLNVFPAGTTTITAPNNMVGFTASATDPGGSIASYLWTKVSGAPSVTFSSTNQSTTTVTVGSVGTVVIRCTVTDNSGTQTTSDQTVIYQAATNQPPVIQVSQGNPGAIYLPVDSLILVSTATDADGTIVSDVWTVSSMPAGAPSPGSTGSGNRIVFHGLVAGSYTFTRTVKDNSNAVTSVDVTIQVVALPNPLSNFLILQGGGGKIIFK